MKKHSIVLIFVIIVSVFSNPCLANPLSSIISFFQKDLVLDVLFTNHKNLIQGSDVYLAEDLEKQRILIGKVKNISFAEPQLSKVEIIIDKKYKDKIFETTSFVLMSNIFSEKSDAYIVAISSTEPLNKKPLKSGSSLNGVTFVEYKIATAGEQFKKIMNSLKKQNNEILSQLEQYIDNFDTEAFQKKIDDLGHQISKFSAEQKETFKNEILPSLRKMVDFMIEKLQEQNNNKKSNELEKQLKDIENMVDV